MRIRRLDLVRYGRFTDHRLDLGEAAAGRPDLHVVFGPNEAGKSTALAAFLDLLFGMGKTNSYAFLHPYPAMRVGAALDLGDETREFIRLKRDRNTLLDGRDQPVAEASILAELGGIDRAGYRAMFSLDDETLEKGGDSILASQGDIGQLLFSASAGLADLGRNLDVIRTQTESFYKYKAQKGELASLKARLDILRKERDAVDARVSDVKRLVVERDRAEGQYDGTVEVCSRLRARLEQIDRQLGAWPRLQVLRRLHESLSALGPLPEAPPHWRDELPDLTRRDTELAVESKAVAGEIAAAEEALGSVALDDAAPRLAGALDDLADLRARHRTAEKDLPDRRQRLRDVDGQIAALLRRLDRDGEPDPARLLLGAMVTGRLRGLIERRSGIDAAVSSAEAEQVAARRRLDLARSDLAAAGDSGKAEGHQEAALARLAVVADAVRAVDHTARRRLAVRALAEVERELAARLQDLAPWTGATEALVAMRVPDAAALDAWRTSLAETRRRAERQADEVERLTTSWQLAEAARDAIGATAGLVTDAAAAQIRAARDAAWAAHRDRLDDPSAEHFEAALRRDDAAGAVRLVQAADHARLRQAAEAAARVDAELRRAQELADMAMAARRAVETEIATTLGGLSPTLSDLLPPRLEAWLGRRSQALDAVRRVDAGRRSLREIDEEATDARTRLAGALDVVGLRPADADLEGLLNEALRTIDRAKDLRTRHAALAAAQRDLAERDQACEAARAAARHWAEAWAETCGSSWLVELDATPAIETVREILEALPTLAAFLNDRAEMADRVEKMERDRDGFRDQILRLADTAGLVPADRPTLDLARTLDARVAAARAAKERHVALDQALGDARRRQATLVGEHATHAARVAEMTTRFGVATLDEVALKLSQAEKRADLLRQVGETESGILDALRVSSLLEAERLLEAADVAVLQAEREELTARVNDLDLRCRDLYHVKTKAEEALAAVGGDARAAEIEEARRTVLLEIEDGAMRYLRLRLGVVAAEQALRAYRDRHRSSMMTRASDAFRIISRGAYSGLTSQPGKDGETLIAMTAGGGSKEAVELSKGTRFQLYLALRVAGYHEFARARRPVPFIADDIMETFDDFRAEEAFRLFAGMAMVGQVIYLTHHRHLCGIAREICPTVTLHELGAA